MSVVYKFFLVLGTWLALVGAWAWYVGLWP